MFVINDIILAFVLSAILSIVLKCFTPKLKYFRMSCLYFVYLYLDVFNYLIQGGYGVYL